MLDIKVYFVMNNFLFSIDKLLEVIMSHIIRHAHTKKQNNIDINIDKRFEFRTQSLNDGLIFMLR